MSKSWPNRYKDLMIAEQMLSQFVSEDLTGLNLFELVVDTKKKSMNFRLSPWVWALAEKYTSMYGEEQGEVVVRRVLSYFLRENQVLH